MDKDYSALAELPAPLLTTILVYLPAPNALLRTSRAFAGLAREPHAVAQWLLAQNGSGKGGPLAALTSFPFRGWPAPGVVSVLLHCLACTAPDRDTALRLLAWASSQLGDAAAVEAVLRAAPRASPGSAAMALTSEDLSAALSEACSCSCSGRADVARVLLSAGEL